MKDTTFDKLADAIKLRGGGVPVVKCPELREVLEELFTEEEASLACLLPEDAASVDMLVAQTERSRKEIEELLEFMASKGLVLSLKDGDKRTYRLFGLAPSIFENQLSTGIVSDRTRRIALLIKQYSQALLHQGQDVMKLFPEVPFARIVSVEKNIAGNVAILPHDKLTPYIDSAKGIALLTCHCKQMGELLGKPCSKPKEVCLAMGEAAHYFAEYGIGRLITKEEAFKIIELAEKEGLVHSVSNTGDHIDFICNCCICHCDLLRSLRKSIEFGSATVSNFITNVDNDECIGCGDCLARCPMRAIALNEETAVIDQKRCIGCGLCVSVCPTGALKMHNREEAIIPYANSILLNKAIVDSISAE